MGSHRPTADFCKPRSVTQRDRDIGPEALCPQCPENIPEKNGDTRVSGGHMKQWQEWEEGGQEPLMSGHK